MNIEFDISMPSYPKISGLPLEDRQSTALMLSALCKEDKEQMNRIEEKLDKLLSSVQSSQCLK